MGDDGVWSTDERCEDGYEADIMVDEEVDEESGLFVCVVEATEMIKKWNRYRSNENWGAPASYI